MELAFIVPIGAAIGALAWLVTPKRQLLGAVTLPVLGLLAASLVWVIATWLGFGSAPSSELAWISWPTAIVVSLVATLVAGRVIAARRDAADQAELARVRA